MLKTILKLLLGFALLTVSQACAPGMIPGAIPSTLDPNSISTAIAGTRVAALTQTAQSMPIIAQQNSPTPAATTTFSPTPFPTYTLVVLGPPQLTVTVNTNCRAGPGQSYGRVGALLVGEVALVVGRSLDGKYWVIRNPDRAGNCWLAARFAVLSGNFSSLPRIAAPTPTRTPKRTPKPAPTRANTAVPPTVPSVPSVPSSVPVITPTATTAPTFVVTYNGLESCDASSWWTQFRLHNTTPITFQSIAITVRDTTTGSEVFLTSEDFISQIGCTGLETSPELLPGDARDVSSPAFLSNPDNLPLQAIINLCSGPGQTGTCITQTLDYTP